MTMNNSSLYNEPLISLIMLNLKERVNVNPVTVIRNTVFNQTILPEIKKMKCNLVPRNEKNHRLNMAKAYKILRYYFRYNHMVFCGKNPDCDSLYHAINDFKYRLNSDFFTIFEGV
jgi:hypothetical protein